MTGAARVVERLARLFAAVTAINDEPRCAPGADAAAIESAFAARGLRPTPELTALHAWHDGIGYLDAFLSLLPVEEARDIHARLDEFIEGAPDFGWRRTWWPLLDINGDGKVCIDLESGAVHFVSLESDKVIRIAVHYCDYLAALESLFAEAAYRFDEEGGSIEADPDGWERIAKAHDVIGLGEL